MPTRIRKLTPRDFDFDDDSVVAVERYYPDQLSKLALIAIRDALTSTPAEVSAAVGALAQFGVEEVTGKLRAVRMRYPASQAATLTSVRLRIVKELGQASPSSDDFLIYDSGLLEEGEIPAGGTVAIDLTGDDATAFWLDDMGDDGPCFDGQFRCEMAIVSTGADADRIVLSLDTEENVT